MTRGEAIVLRVFAVWTTWVWGTRIGNVMGDDSRSTAFKAVHVVLAIISVAFAIATWVIVRRVRRRVAHQ
jgi:predicted branched-subunit amino acid permease